MKKSLVFELPEWMETDQEQEWRLLIASDPTRHHGPPVPVSREALKQQLSLAPDLVGHARAFAKAHGEIHMEQLRPELGAFRLRGTGRACRGALEALQRAAKGVAQAGPAAKALAALGPKIVAAVPRRATVSRRSRWTFGIPKGARGLFTAPMLKAGYGFPGHLRGEGQRIAVLLMGGGFTPEAFGPGLDTYFKSIGLEIPNISVMTMPGAENKPAPMEDIERHVLLISGAKGMPAARHHGFRWKPGIQPKLTKPILKKLLAENELIRWSGEGIMDVELIGSIADRATIAIYLTNDTAIDIFDTIVRAVDEQSTVINCSFGGPERNHAPGEMQLIDAALMYAAARGVTVCASTGDRGCAADENRPGRYAIEYPASSPWALAVGGTRLLFDDNGGSAFTGEHAWNETILGNQRAGGGGFSQTYDAPAWQQEALSREDPDRRMRRGVPDVSGAAALASGCWIWFGDKEVGVNSAAAGTSAAVPIWSGLVALLNEALKTRLGLLAPRLYNPIVQPHFFNVRRGNNRMGKLKDFKARQGWNPCTGIGAPRGEALLDALKKIMGPPAIPPSPPLPGQLERSIRSSGEA